MRVGAGVGVGGGVGVGVGAGFWVRIGGGIRVKGGARVRVERGTERAVVKVRDEADEAEQLLLGLGELLGWGLRPHVTADEGALAW